MAALNKSPIEWGVAMASIKGQTESGDRYFVSQFPDGALLAVIDGLGHGEEAAAAARIAEKSLSRCPQTPLDSLLERCHESLHQTRGVVMSVATINAREGTLNWVAVGNVGGNLFSANPSAERRAKSLVLRGGVVGIRLPPLQVTALPIEAGDTLVLATDGVGGEFSPSVYSGGEPQLIAERLLARHAKGTDDALVLVARYRGKSP